MTARRLLISAILAVFASVLSAQPQRTRNAAELKLLIDKLSVAGTALYVGAHPDDENTAMLAWLGNERLVRAGYLSITRGDGGQNLIGSEKGDLLGVIRTQELLAARKIDGAEQFFTRALDFGYSKTPEETFHIWGKEKVLSDVVWVIRNFRPDVVITRFPTTGAGGHGHHTASAILAQEAMEAAADPKRFPEQLVYTKPWRVKRVLWNAFQRPGDPAPSSETLSIDLGSYNELLGRSYTEIAAESRSMHKSQGFGAAERRGTLVARLEHMAGERAQNDLFEGVDQTWNRFPGGAALGQVLGQASREFNPENPSSVVPLLVRAYRMMSALPDEPLIKAKRRDLQEVIRSASGLWLEAIAAKPSASPGSEVKVTMTLVSRSAAVETLSGISSAWGSNTIPTPVEIKENQPVTQELVVHVPPSAPDSNPYWLNGPIPQQMIGQPENSPALTVQTRLQIAGETLEYAVPVLYRTVDRVRGELYQPFIIAPAATVHLSRPLQIFIDNQPQDIKVSVARNDALTTPLDGIANVRIPQDWKAAPSQTPIRVENEPVRLTYSVTPPGRESSGELLPRFEASQPVDRTEVVIDYEHIPRQTLFPRASTKLVRINLARRGDRVGYVMGSGDEIPEALRQIGYDVTLLSDSDLEQGTLEDYDAIVTGIRAYNTRDALRGSQKRLLDYVFNGGTLVVQYNTDESIPTNLGPYPLKLSRDRVTEENAEMKILVPDHPLLNTPNRITAADFAGWVQERGLYFPNEWDAKYQPLLATADQGESEKRGSLLYARYGKGVYIHSGLAWFRQLPAGVPGAYRIFANLVSARGE
jgi:LmbE family N-acetylglucosaminyl deacetylase